MFPARQQFLFFSAKKKCNHFNVDIFLKAFHVCSDCELLCLRVKNYTDIS